LKTTKQRETYGSIEEYEENCYLFSPSISKRRSVGGKSYFVRRYFRGGQDPGVKQQAGQGEGCYGGFFWEGI